MQSSAACCMCASPRSTTAGTTARSALLTATQLHSNTPDSASVSAQDMPIDDPTVDAGSSEDWSDEDAEVSWP